MRNNPVIALLVGVLLVCGLFTVWVSARYYFSVTELQRLQNQAVAINQIRTAAYGLANECVQYSQKNPAIVPLLRHYKILSQGPSGAAPVNPPPQPQP